MADFKHRRDDYKPRPQFLVLPSFLSWLAPLVGPIQVSETKHWVPGLVAETFLCFLFCTELIPTIWFGPMSILAATEGGEEWFYAAAYASPFLLLVPKVREAMVTETTWVYLATLAGIPSYSAGSYHVRSVMIMLGVAFGVLVHFSQFWRADRRERSISCLLFGLFLLVSTRFMFSTLYVVWMSRTLNWIFFLLGILAANVLGSDPELQYHESHVDIEANAKVPGEFNVISPDALKRGWRAKLILSQYGSWIGILRFGISFGCLQFLTQWLLSTHGIIPRWIDLDPFPYGIGMMMAMATGIMMSHLESVVRSVVWWAIAVLAAPSILILPPNLAIWSGYIVIAYLASIWYVAVVDMSRHSHIVPTLLLSFAVYFVTNLGVIWSIAWCFVPQGTGGPFMRQRVGQLFTMTVLFSSFSYFKTSSPHLKRGSPLGAKPGNNSSSNRLLSRQFITLFLLIVVLVTVPAILKRSLSYGSVDGNGVQKDHIRGNYHFPTLILEGMIWAIRFGYNNFGWVNFEDVANKIKAIGANTIGLVESDSMRPFNGNRDIVEYLEEQLHMYSDYGPSTMNDTWGCALLSVFPIVRADRYNQPSPDGEIACLIDASLDVGGEIIDVIVTHFGNTEHYRDRELQAQAVVHRIEDKKKKGQEKVVWLGYLTDRPGGVNYKKLIAAGLEDVSPDEQERYCLYLFHMGMEISDFERIEMKEDISDTEIQIANFHWKK